jgi:hypothetical protein
VNKVSRTALFVHTIFVNKLAIFLAGRATER